MAVAQRLYERVVTEGLEHLLQEIPRRLLSSGYAITNAVMVSLKPCEDPVLRRTQGVDTIKAIDNCIKLAFAEEVQMYWRDCLEARLREQDILGSLAALNSEGWAMSKAAYSLMPLCAKRALAVIHRYCGGYDLLSCDGGVNHFARLSRFVQEEGLIPLGRHEQDVHTFVWFDCKLSA